MALLTITIQTKFQSIQGMGDARKAAWVNDKGRDVCTSCTHSHVHCDVLPGGGLLVVDVPFPLLAHQLFPRLWLITKASLVTVPDEVRFVVETLFSQDVPEKAKKLFYCLRCSGKDPGPIKGVRCPGGRL